MDAFNTEYPDQQWGDIADIRAHFYWRLSDASAKARARAVAGVDPYKVVYYRQKVDLAQAAKKGDDVAVSALQQEADERGLSVAALADIIIDRAAAALGAAQRINDAETAAWNRIAQSETAHQCEIAIRIDWDEVIEGPPIALDADFSRPILKPLPQLLAAKMAELRAAPTSNNFEADDLKLCAEFAAHAAEGNADAIQALTPLAEASGVSVEAFVQQELDRESARRARVIQLRAAQITFERRIETADNFDALAKIRDDIESFSI